METSQAAVLRITPRLQRGHCLRETAQSPQDGGREGVPDPRPQMNAQETAGALTRAADNSR